MGESYECLIGIINDTVLEGNQSFTVKITSDDPGVYINCSSTVVTIHEDPNDCESFTVIGVMLKMGTGIQ